MARMEAARAGAGMARLEPIDVEELLVWTYRDQRADVVIGRGVGLHGLEAAADGIALQAVSACGCAGVARIAELGVRVDRMGRDAGALHPDAELVHQVVSALTGKVNGLPHAQLLIRHAARGGRPDELVCAVPRAMPYLHEARGTVRVEWLDTKRRYGFCPISWQPSAAMIAAAREEYSAWWHALRLVAFCLMREARMVRWRALMPAAPARPWENT